MFWGLYDKICCGKLDLQLNFWLKFTRPLALSSFNWNSYLYICFQIKEISHFFNEPHITS